VGRLTLPIAALRTQRSRWNQSLILLSAGISLGLLSTLSPIAGGLLAAGLLLIALSSAPARSLWLLIFLTPLTSGLPRRGAIPVRANEVLLIAFAVAIGLALWRRRRLLAIDKSLEYAILLFLFFASVVPLVVHFVRDQPISAEIMPYVAPWQYYILYKLVANLRLSEKWMRRLLQASILAGVVLALVSLLQAANVEAVWHLLRTYYPSIHLDKIQGVGYQRTTSLLGNWHGAGVYYAFNLLSMVVAWSQGKRLFPLGMQLGFVVLLALALVTTNSFTAIAVLAFGLFITTYKVGWLKSRRVWVAISLIIPILGISALVFSSRLLKQASFQFGDYGYAYGYMAHPGSWLPRTVVNRFIDWQEKLWPVIRETWLWGYGPTLPDVGVQSDDSQFIYMLLKGGIFYVLAFWVLVMTILRVSQRRFEQAPAGTWSRTIALLSLVLMAVLLPACLLQAYMNYSGVAEHLWMVVGLMSGVRWLYHNDKTQMGTSESQDS